ncbi:choice-of-anchor I family protein [Aeromicrobium piscarium]|uniref:LPXTG cell wall anchor domain-containing protein n=1 Tax=Aeromicrobium piscarium TaxID=2590901 RepID=A0A554RUM3_9ACTN|nr:choice-of-anchor I family protein [Aeromicrobium piscarium]TSD57811.1 LPXTG cell wall anchor domain-containing protein [Aeromicrobium piscarium]
MHRRLLSLTAATALVLGTSAAAAATTQYPADTDPAGSLTPLGTYHTGQFDESAAEIVAFHAGTQRTFVVNALSGQIDVLDASDPTSPVQVGTIAAPEGVVNSLSVREDGLVVAAIEAPTKTDPGHLLFADATTLQNLGTVEVGAQPDMVSISPDGAYAVSADEGEPADDYSADPEGTVSVVTLPDELTAPGQETVRTATFHDWEENGPRDLPEEVRIFGPEVNADRPVSANLEPEYVAIDGTTAYVTLQENNAIAVVDLIGAQVTDLWPMGFKDHSQPGMGFDASDRDDAIAIEPQPVLGMYQPDGIGAYSAGGQTYLVTANEGDAREWGDYAEGARVKNLGKDGLAPICEDATAAALTGDADLGRLNITLENGLREDGSCYEQLYSFGGRSFSIWTPEGDLVFDSGDEFERIVAEALPEHFNSNHSESNFDGRSDDKGPEPENLAIGQVGDRTYAFIGFERVGGVIAYDITDPTAPEFVRYTNERDFSVSAEEEIDGGADPADVLRRAGDLGPEGVAFVAAADSPTEQPLVITGNEVSGSTTFFAVTTEDEDGSGPGPDPEPTEPTPTEPAPTEPPSEPAPTDAPGTDPPGDSPAKKPTGDLPGTGATVSPWWFALGAALLAGGGLVTWRRLNA